MSISYVELMCCLFWKTLWDFYMVLHSKEDWTTYFRTINIPDDASTTYAAIFHKNHMTDEILAEPLLINFANQASEYLETLKLSSIMLK